MGKAAGRTSAEKAWRERGALGGRGKNQATQKKNKNEKRQGDCRFWPTTGKTYSSPETRPEPTYEKDRRQGWFREQGRAKLSGRWRAHVGGALNCPEAKIGVNAGGGGGKSKSPGPASAPTARARGTRREQLPWPIDKGPCRAVKEETKLFIHIQRRLGKAAIKRANALALQREKRGNGEGR